ncbi:PspA/IM30 family protein [Aporhodopirellula aestuarii]|uniref:PspA/IM30 family protein n=1 Tax=Aporhodopirellula aestuarii TaxID=2950107 RepID=A0ABT0U0Y1_9BACT|nr:PspA/IM30 family protein [Aporhodopirellula aestuarii]MCM2370549.1 PspA/IM30 family protein [Aporhodopirellula aestuarii]
MKWFSQFSLIMRSNVTSLCEQVENPERMLHQLILDMQEELAKVKHSVAEAIADEILMRKTVEREQADVERWGQRAEDAVRRGDDSSAKAALQRQIASRSRAEQYAGEHATQQAEVQKLRDAVRNLEDKIRQAKQKKTLLTARLARATSTNKINSVIDRVDSQSAFSQFERLSERVDREEAVSEAWQRLDGEQDEDDALHRKFEQDELTRQLDSELESLKARVDPPAS